MPSKNQRRCCWRPVNTGVNTFTDPSFTCLLDSIWEMTGRNPGTGPGFDSAFIPTESTLSSLWIQNTSLSKWLSPDCDGQFKDLADKERVYKVEWDIPEDPSGMRLCGRFAVDNLLTKTELNGTDIGLTFIKDPPGSCEDKIPGFNRWHVFELNEPAHPFVQGINTLEFTTLNHEGSCASPAVSGFRCEFSCKCGCDCKDPSDSPLCEDMCNTGIVGLPSTGTGCERDACWEEASGANYIGDRPYPTSWYSANPAVANWLTPSCEALDEHGAARYEYTLNFTVNADPDTIRIVGWFTVDNRLVSMVLNDVDLGISWMPVPCDPEDNDELCMTNPCWFEIRNDEGLVTGTGPGPILLGNNKLVVVTESLAGLCQGAFQAGFQMALLCDFIEGTGSGRT